MSGAQYIPAAKGYFESRVIPREKKVEITEPMRSRLGTVVKAKKKFHKQKLKRTQEGGKPYGLCQPLPKLAQFGLGIAMYFYVLLILMVCNIGTGLILLPRIANFALLNGDNNISDPRVYGTAACPDLREVELYGGEKALFRPRCDFPDKASTWSDFTICVVFAAAIVAAMLLQRHFETQLDERVASAQDYSIVVENPPEDADSPDEWRAFFSQFGLVRYITVNRQNRRLLLLLLKKRLLMRHFPARYYTDAETTELDGRAAEAARTPLPWKVQFMYDKLGVVATESDQELLVLLHQLNTAIRESCTRPHIVSSIFVTFEYEDEKQSCLLALENENSLLQRCFGRKHSEYRFRGVHLLRTEESSEPDNIAWLNSSLDDPDRLWRKALSFLCSGGILLLCFLMVQAAYGVSALALLVVITGLDSTLPYIFTVITNMEGNVDEDDRQESFMMKLFVGRILCAVIFPLLFTPWETMLNVDQLASIKNVQLSCCFVTPLVRLADAPGVFKRQILTRYFAKSESDALRFWSGTPFTLAERYSEIAKIMFISLFYSFLDPTALFFAGLACLNSFFIDRYLLLRKSAPPPLLDNSMGPMVFKLLALSLLAKVIMSLYFAYSWTFDEVYFDAFGNYQKIDKSPPKVFWNMQRERWHTELQWTAVSYYIDYATVAIAYCFVICFYQWFGELYLHICGGGRKPVECSNKTPYSAVGNIICYCPVVHHGPESFLAADTTDMLRKHRPDTIDLNDRGDQEFNFESYLPSNYDATCLAKVKWYSSPLDPPLEDGPAAWGVSSRSIEGPRTPVRAAAPTSERSAESRPPQGPPGRTGRILGGRGAVALSPLPQREADSDITRRIRKELSRHQGGRFSGRAAVDPSGNGLVDFDHFLALLRERCPATCRADGAGGPGAASPSRRSNLENKLKAVFMNELLRQNRIRNGVSDLVDFDEFLDHMRQPGGSSTGAGSSRIL